MRAVHFHKYGEGVDVFQIEERDHPELRDDEIADGDGSAEFLLSPRVRRT